MSSDYYSLLKRYSQRRVCLTLHGQMAAWGKVAEVCYDGLRLVEAQVVSELDNPGLFQQLTQEQAHPNAPKFRETLVHLNQILAITCLDPDLPEPEPEKSADQTAERRLLVDPLELVLGSNLIPLVEEVPVADTLPARLEQLRTNLAADLGLLLPKMTIRSHKSLAANEYVLRIRGVAALRGTLEADEQFALEAEPVNKVLSGRKVKKSPFGLPGVWIRRGQSEQAELYGYQIVQPAGYLVSAFESLFRKRAADLFGRQQLEELLDQVRLSAPAVVEEVIPDLMRPRHLLKILRALLRELVPIRDLEGILETLADCAFETNELDVLVERVRQGVATTLMDRYCDASGHLYAIPIDHHLEEVLLEMVRPSSRGPQLVLTPRQRRGLLGNLQPRLAELAGQKRPEIVVTQTPLRAALAQMLGVAYPHVLTLSYDEIEAATEVHCTAPVHVSGELFPALQPPPPSKEATAPKPSASATPAPKE